ncbi:unnamed protein product [Calypogeia fissa]
MKSLSRSRSLRGNALPTEQPGREREPFFLGPFRQQKSFSLPSTPSRNRSRANGENVPPDNNHTAATAAYVKANTPTPDAASPAAQPRSSKKGRNGGAVPLPGSPALLPRPPSGKPSPVGPKVESLVAQGQDNLMTAKRKLHWDGSGSNAADTVGVASLAETTGPDSGVKVIIRMRPLNEKEEQEEATKIVHKIASDAVTLGDQQFTYDAIAGEGASQQDVFEMVGSPMVENCLAGFNSSIFAYGQTGSGKTHTMMGLATDPDSSSLPSDHRGLTPRVIERLFSRMQQEEELHIDKGLRYQCRCSFLEIYNEQITDLLDPTQRNLQIREDTKTGVYVDNLTEEYVSDVDDVTRLLLKGFTNRRTGATIMNNESSRSHSVFTCVIESRFKNLAEGGSSVRSSRMNLVDLAGSERQKQSGAAGERLKEAGNINKSLSQLGNVINILAEVAQTGRLRHIPYRDSRLTFLLQESLGGNAKLAMICAVSPASSCRSETLSTLRFAQRAKAVQNKAVVNEETSSDVGLLREQIRQLKDELMRMKGNKSSEGGTGGYSNSWNARRSYNLLRLSLSHPMTLSGTDLEEPDLDMDIEGNEEEPDGEVTHSVLASKDSTSQQGFPRLPMIDEKNVQAGIPSITAQESGVADVADDEVLDTADPNISGHELQNTDDDSVNLGLEITESPKMFETPEVMKISELIVPRALHSPPQSVSPRLKITSKRQSSGSPLAPGPVASSFAPSNSTCEIYHSTQDRFYDGTSTSQSLQVNNDLGRQSSMRASISTGRPTEKLAACLQRGLQILDSHQRTSISSVRRSFAGLRASMQANDFQLPRMVEKFDKAVQTSGTVLVTTSTSPIPQFAPQPAVDASPRCELFQNLADDCSTSSPSLLLQEGLQETSCTEIVENTPRSSTSDLRLYATSKSPLVAQELDTRPGASNDSVQPSVVHAVQQPVDGNRLSSSSLEDTPDQCTHDIPSSNRHIPVGISSNTNDTSNWQLVALDCPKSSSVAACDKSTLQPVQEIVEAVLAGAIRRERVAEEAMSKQAAEIEQLNRLVRQYKHERECNAILHQSREEKIARLESLMDNVIPVDTYLNEEWSALLLEYKMLEEKFDNHPEVTQSSVEQQRLLDELNHYRNFFDLGERDILLEEVKLLRNQVQTLLENHPSKPSSAARQRRLSLARISVQTSKLAEGVADCASPSSLALLSIPLEGPQEVLMKPSSDLSMVATGAAVNFLPPQVEERVEEESCPRRCWEDEKREMELDWEERERDWMAVLEELREEAESYKREVDRRKQELDSEKRCSDEMRDALQMAMTGHARLLEQYAELQEKHIVLLAKHRKIKEGTADVKKMAKKAGVTSLESRWLDAQALQIVALKLETEEERETSKEEIESLKAQLQDTADAVQAAGELLVRLKEAEESVTIAQDAAAMAEQDAGVLRRDLEKLRRRHATEVATLQQRVLESRLQKTAVCPMCVMAERVKFQFTEVDSETAQAELEAEARAMALEEEQEWMDPQQEDILREYHRQQRELYSPERQKVLAENRKNQREPVGSDWTGELELENQVPLLDDFDEIDHFFTQS